MGSISVSQGYRLGVDVGGTFTDVCVIGASGETFRAKVPSTPNDQSIGVQNGIRSVREQLKLAHGWDGQFDCVHHGTTVATNAVIESKGARTGLIVTAGHKDVLALRRSQIPGGLGAWLNFKLPPPIVPLERTVQCPERVSIRGEVVKPVDREAFCQALAELKRQKPEAISVSLLNSFSNPANEKAVSRILREEFGDDVEIVCSSDVLPEVGEYERTLTTSANAVMKPVVRTYLRNLQNKLAEDTKLLRILKSDGQLTSTDLAGEFPVNILMSGPAGGVIGVTQTITKNTPYKNLITLDMGGTSTDCALIRDGSPALRRETLVESLTVRAPSIDVRTVGAGGGSIADYVSLTSTLRVGPESAGAQPGPACYGNGGKLPTVTDANVLLGYLPPKLLGGAFELDVAASIQAVEDLARQMGLSADEAAEGIINIVNETMYGALRLVSVEQGYDPREFALVAFGGAGPLHANAVGKLLGAWPVIIPNAPGLLCAQGDATTKLSHELSSPFIKLLSSVTADDMRAELYKLRDSCISVIDKALGDKADTPLDTTYQADLRYKGQALTITVDLSPTEVEATTAELASTIRRKFEIIHEQQFTFSMPSYELELMRLRAVTVDASFPGPVIARTSGKHAADDSTTLESARRDKKLITVEGKKVEAYLYDRTALTKEGLKIPGPCVISETDSNTLILPGFFGEIDSMGNILIWPQEDSLTPQVHTKSYTPETAKVLISKTPLIPTLVMAALASIRREMDTLMLRCSMSPAIREQQDEFNVISNAAGKMLVGQFGSFVPSFLEYWKGHIEEGDVFITNDVYHVSGAVSHLNDVIILLPIFYRHQLVGWAANFGHLTDVQGKVPGSMSINANTIFEDGLQIPPVKLYSKGTFNQDLLDVLTRNSRLPEWFSSDIKALVAACRTAATRVCELCDRYSLEVYNAACDDLLERNRSAVARLIETEIDDKPSTFTDFIDDNGLGVGPFALSCKMQKVSNKLVFDWDGTSPQSDNSINYYFSTTLFKMFVGYYFLQVFDPYCVVNDGFHDLIEVNFPEGSCLRPVRPAALSCRTHMIGRSMDIIQALLGQKNPSYMAAAGTSDSPHFFFSGFDAEGEHFLLYQIGFGGVPARPAGDGPDCHCLFPAMRNIPCEIIELYFPLRIEANESLADTGGAGFYRGGNAQRTLYRFLARGEFSLHDDRWFTKPWGIQGGSPGSRSRKVLYRYSLDAENPPMQVLPSKCDHIKVQPNDLLEWITWGGGGRGDPTTRPADLVALEVQRKLVTIAGAKDNYGVVVRPDDFSVDDKETSQLREKIRATRPPLHSVYNRGGTLKELREACLAETGLQAPQPQWEVDPYGPHVKLHYVQNWYRQMREAEDWVLQ
ncbi:Hydantoinase/oxoprolinase domain-containing protein [Cladophialophora immunda]|nr:Hydantoinase/oxoprolinase domain-containing protein [Cladophialophora immunda]